jgi:hypothetical protein
VRTGIGVLRGNRAGLFRSRVQVAAGRRDRRMPQGVADGRKIRSAAQGMGAAGRGSTHSRAVRGHLSSRAHRVLEKKIRQAGATEFQTRIFAEQP